MTDAPFNPDEATHPNPSDTANLVPPADFVNTQNAADVQSAADQAAAEQAAVGGTAVDQAAAAGTVNAAATTPPAPPQPAHENPSTPAAPTQATATPPAEQFWVCVTPEGPRTSDNGQVHPAFQVNPGNIGAGLPPIECPVCGNKNVRPALSDEIPPAPITA